MAETLQLKVVTPEGSLLDEEVASFTAGSGLGEFCILPDHRPILASLSTSRMIVEQSNGTKTTYALDRGFLEAGLDHVSVITERCIASEELDKSDLTSEVAALEEKLTPMDLGTQEAEELIRDLEWAKARLDVTE